MGLIFFALFLLVPIIEIYGFIQIGSLIGLWPTLGIVILTAIAGSALLRHQGMAVLFRTQSMIEQGKLPVDQMIDGVCLALAGALLLTPGFFTDIFGFLLFIPPFRQTLARSVFKKFILPNATIFTNGAPYSENGAETQTEQPFQNERYDQNYDDGQGPIIDGEFEEARPANSSKNYTDETETKNSPAIDSLSNSHSSSPWNDKPNP